MNIKLLQHKYRGFELGYVEGLYGYKPCWRSSLDDKWHESAVYANDFSDIVPLAKQCIDFNYIVQAEELSIGRPLTVNEVAKLTK